MSKTYAIWSKLKTTTSRWYDTLIKAIDQIEQFSCHLLSSHFYIGSTLSIAKYPPRYMYSYFPSLYMHYEHETLYTTWYIFTTLYLH